jgi:hypothetical protein
MTDAQLQPIADAAALYIKARLLVPAEFGPVAPRDAVTIPNSEPCPSCGSVRAEWMYVNTSEASITQSEPAAFLRAECKGVLDAIVGQLNLVGGPIVTHPSYLPSGVSARVLAEQNGVALRAVAVFDIAQNKFVLAFHILYSKRLMAPK